MGAKPREVTVIPPFFPFCSDKVPLKDGPVSDLSVLSQKEALNPNPP